MNHILWLIWEAYYHIWHNQLAMNHMNHIFNQMRRCMIIYELIYDITDWLWITHDITKWDILSYIIHIWHNYLAINHIWIRYDTSRWEVWLYMNLYMTSQESTTHGVMCLFIRWKIRVWRNKHFWNKLTRLAY